MKTKELVPGKQYAIRQGPYGRALKGLCLSTTEKYVRTSRHTGVPANTALGQRGGIPFAIEGWQGGWVPVVVQPSAVFAQADDFDKAVEAKRAADEAERQARQEAARQRAMEDIDVRQAKRDQYDALVASLVARGLPAPTRYDERNGSVQVDEAFLQQVVRRLKVKVPA